jgi:hypothetical protein
VKVIERHVVSVSAEDEHVRHGVDVAGVAVSWLGLHVVDEPEFIFVLLQGLVVVLPMFPLTHLLVVGVKSDVAIFDNK